MFLIARPSEARINAFLESLSEAPLSYPDVGLSRDGGVPAGYHLHHRRVLLGHGAETFAAAAAALGRWSMFDVGWARLCWPTASTEPGSTVAVLARVFGIWSLNACRVVYTLDDPEGGAVRRVGFGYGTLSEHAMKGEERFMVEWHAASGEVWYDLLAFSMPGGWISRLTLPIVRRLQWRFGTGSLDAMRRATSPRG